MNATEVNIRDEIEHLAKEAFNRNLISGYGHGQYRNEYQIVCNGKPRHYPLEQARALLQQMIKNSD